MASRRNPYDPTGPAQPINDTYADYFSGEQGGGANPEPPPYTPPNGNTGVSGYIPGGVPMPEGGPTQPPEQNFPQDFPKPPKQYAPIQGFDFGKLSGQTPYDSSEKYSDAVRMFSQGLASGITPTRGQLDPMVQYARANGFGGANAIGDDKIDFGDGAGPIDILTSGGQIWFQNGADRFEQPGGQGIGPVQNQASLPPAGGSNPDLMKILQSLFPGGAFNQDIVNRRTENASSTLRRDANSRKSNNRALLADRGLIGSGPEGSMYGKVDEDIADRYAQEVSGIYSDESENADERMIQALQMAAGLSTADADRALGYLNSNNDFTLGKGNLALGNFKAQNDYNLGLGNFGLDRDRLLADIDSSDMDRMVQLLQLLMSGAQTSSGGHV